jgi:hypothetical protein
MSVINTDVLGSPPESSSHCHFNQAVLAFLAESDHRQVALVLRSLVLPARLRLANSLRQSLRSRLGSSHTPPPVVVRFHRRTGSKTGSIRNYVRKRVKSLPPRFSTTNRKKEGTIHVNISELFPPQIFHHKAPKIDRFTVKWKIGSLSCINSEQLFPP